MHTVKIFNENGKIMPTNVLIDDKPLKGCCSIDYHADVTSVPTVTFEVWSLADIEINHANICFEYHPKSVEEALKILKHSTVSDDVVRKKLVKRIETVLKDMPKEIESYELAEMIVADLVERISELA